MTSDLDITDFDAVADDAENLVVPVTVRNGSDEERDGTVSASVTAGDEGFQQSQSVTVPGNGSTDLERGFTVSYSQSDERGDLSLGVS